MLTAIRGDQIQMDQIHNGHIVGPANTKFGSGIHHEKLYLDNSIVASFLHEDESVHQAVLDSRLIALWDVATSQSVSGSSIDVTTVVASTAVTDTATMGGTEKGVLTTGTGVAGAGTQNYRVQIRDASTKDPVHDEMGGQVYGELTNDSIGSGVGNYTLSFKKSDASDYTMAAAEVSTITAIADVLVENTATGTDTPTYTHSLNGKYFRISSPTTEYYVWYNVSGEPAIDPAAENAGKTGLAVTVAPEADEAAVAAATASVLAANADFSASSSLETITVTNTNAGVPLSALADGIGGKETGFGFVIATPGAPTMVDFMFAEVYSYLTAPYQAFITGVGFADVVGVAGSHNHHDLYYTKIELESGQLDNRYYTKSQMDSGQLDNRYYTESEIDPNPGSDAGDAKLDTRYYKESEISSSAAGASGAKLVGVAPTGNLSSANVQDALVELQTDVDGILDGSIDISFSLDDAYDDGSVVAVDDTNVDWQLTDTKSFKVTSDAGVTDVVKVTADAAGDSVAIAGTTGITGATTVTGNFTATGNLDLNGGTVDIDGTNVTIDGTAASSVATTAAPLTVETKTSGVLTVRSAGALNVKDQFLGAALPLSQTGVTGLSVNLNSGVSIIGAINENTDDLYTLINTTLPATTDGASGADQIGATGITGIIPTGGTLGGDATVQAMLEGIAKGAAGGKVFPTVGTSADGTQTGDPTNPGSLLAEKASGMYFKANEIIYIKDENRFVMIKVQGAGVAEGTDWDYLWGANEVMGGPAFNVSTDTLSMETTGAMALTSDSGITLFEDSGAQIALTAAGTVDIDAAAGQAIAAYSDTEIELNGGALVDIDGTAITMDGQLTATGAAGDNMVVQTSGTGEVQLTSSDAVVVNGGALVDVNADVVDIDGNNSVAVTAPVVDIDGATSVDIDGTAINTTGVLTQTGDTQIVGAMDLDGSIDHDGTSFNSSVDTFTATTNGSINLQAGGTVDMDADIVDVDATTSVDVNAPAINTTGVLTQTGNAQVVGDVDIDGSVDIDGVNFDVDVTGAASIDADAASNFSVAGADLTLSTSTAGNVVVDAADTADINAPVVDIDATTSVDVDAPAINTTGVLTQTGDTQIVGAMNLDGAIDHDGASFNSNVTGNFVATAAGTVDVDGAAVTVDASGAVSIDAGAASNFSTSAGNLTIGAAADAVITAGGQLDVDTVGDAHIDSANVWVEVAQDGDAHIHTTGTGIIHLSSESKLDVDAPSTEFSGNVHIESNSQLYVDKINITSVDPTDYATITGTRSGTLNELNILSNPGFEQGAGADAADWEEVSANSARTDAEQFYNAYSMRYKETVSATAGTEIIVQQTVAAGITDAADYVLSFYMKGTNDAAIQASLGGGTPQQLVAINANPAGWTRYSAVLTAGAANDDLEIFLNNVGGEESSFVIDAVMLEEGSGAASDYFTSYHSDLIFTVGDEDDDQIVFRSEGTSTRDLIRIQQNKVFIDGDLEVTGGTTTINTQDLLVEDNEIVLNHTVTGLPALDAYYRVERGTEDDAAIKWNETTDKWELYNHETSQFETIVTSDSGNVTVSLDAAYDGGSDVTVDATDVAWTLASGRKFTLLDGTDSNKFVVSQGAAADSVKIDTTGGVDIDAAAGITIDGTTVVTGATQIVGAMNLDGAIDHDGASFNSNVTGDFGVVAAGAIDASADTVSVAGTTSVAITSAGTVTVSDGDNDILSIDAVGDEIAASTGTLDLDATTVVTVNSPAINTTGVLTQTGDTQIVGAMNLDGAIDHDGTAFASDVTGDFTVSAANSLTTATTEIDLTAPVVDINGATSVDIDGAAINTTGVLTQVGDVVMTGAMDLNGAIDHDGASFESTVTGEFGVGADVVDIDGTTSVSIDSAAVAVTATGEMDLLADVVDVDGSTSVSVNAPAINITGVLTQTGNAQIVGDLDLDGNFDQSGNYTFLVNSTATAIDAVKVASAGGIDIDAASTLDMVATDINTTGVLTQTGNAQIIGDMNFDGSIDADGADINLAASGTGGTHLKLSSADAASITSVGMTLEAGAGAFVAEADAASSINVTGGNLSLGTTTSGTVALASAGAVTFDDANQTNPINFSQISADGFATEFAYNAQTDFDWSVRDTGTDAITSIMGALNANRQDIYEFVELLSTQGAAVGTAAGANLIGVDGITGVVPMDEGFNPVASVGSDATLQEILNGLATSAGGGKTYTNIAAFTAAKAAGTYYKLNEHVRILDTNRLVIVHTADTNTVEGTDWDFVYGSTRPLGDAEYYVDTTSAINFATVDFDIAATTFDVVASGAVLVDGNSTITVDAASNMVLTSGATMDMNAVTFDIDGTTFDADLTGAFTVDSTGGSHVNVTAGSLNLSTQTSGDINISSVGNIVETAITKEENVTTFDVNASNAFTIDGAASSFLRTTGANLNLQTVGSGELMFKDAGMAAAMPLSDTANRSLDKDPDAAAIASIFDAINRAYNNTGDTSKKTYMEAPSLTSTDVANGYVQVSDEAGLFTGLASGTSDEKVDLPGGAANLSLTPGQLRTTYGVFLAIYLNGLRLSDSEWVYIYDQTTGRKVISFVNDHSTHPEFSWSTVNAVDAITLSVTDHIVFDCTYNKSSNV